MLVHKRVEDVVLGDRIKTDYGILKVIRIDATPEHADGLYGFDTVITVANANGSYSAAIGDTPTSKIPCNLADDVIVEAP